MTVEWHQLALYCLAYAMMVAAPGPFAAAIAARSAAFGFRAGLSLAIGTWFGEKVWMLAAVFGLAAIAASWADALFVLKLIGAGWLIWLGVKLLFGTSAVISSTTEIRREPFWHGVATGASINLGNPKDALFFMVLFPGFFDMAAMTWIDVLIIIAASTPIGLGFDLMYAVLGQRARRLLGGARLARRVDKTTGGVLVGAGVAIAIS
jgi:threonine/homoserine/homoserine lactone efflux protein